MIAAVTQYVLLFGFAAVAAAISAHGLIGFARTNMSLPGPWPYLLWGALDGAAGMCAVLLLRRAARGESAAAPRLAVWGLVAASAWFNWTHAPEHPGARDAFAFMPVIAATLFEFSLRETRHLAAGSRRFPHPLWLRPAERVRAWRLLACDDHMSASEALRRVRVDHAARCLHQLRQTMAPPGRPAALAAGASCRRRYAERRAQAALMRTGFTDPAVAADVLRQVQVMTMTRALAGLDYATPDTALALLANLIEPASSTHHSGAPTGLALPATSKASAGNGMGNGHPGIPGPAGNCPSQLAWLRPASDGAGMSAPADGGHNQAVNGTLVDAASRIVAASMAAGGWLSQAELARRLRADGYHIANGRLRWLSAASGLRQQAGQR